MVARSPNDAAEAKRQLQSDPPNPRARFFDFEIGRQGLSVSVC